MLYIVATILLNVVISAVFKVFPRFRIDALQAIVANYFVCVITGSLFIGQIPFHASVVHDAWFGWSLLMGAGFISIFNLIAFCTRVDGITTATIANKLSLVIPVLFSIVLYHEGSGMGKMAGILLAFPAVYLTTRVTEDSSGKTQSLLWPALLFVGSGLLDTLVKYVQFHFLDSPALQATYTIYCFAAAGTAGVIVVTALLLTGRLQFHWRHLVAGVCVGIPNYFSIYFLIRALNSSQMQSSAIIPVINIGILVASSFMAILFFREKVNKLRIAGLVLSVIAILLIALGDK